MTVRVRFAALSLATLFAACQSDQPSAPLAAPSSGANRTAIPLAPDAAPVTITIFPSIFITGSFSGIPVASVAPAGAASFDRTFHISTSNPSLLPDVPATVTITAGDDRANFGLNPSHTVAVPTNVTVTASGAGDSVSAVLTLLPPNAPPPAKMIDTIFATPLTVAAGTPSTATIRLTQPAPAGGLVVGLFTRLPLSATMPPAVTFAPGQRVATVPITTFVGFPNSTTSVLIEAAAGATLAANGVNVVTGNVPIPLGLGPTTLNAPLVGGIATVVGGTSLTGTVSLTGSAPAGGALVTLVSTDTMVASVPASVTIAAGATSASFPITTKAVSTATSSNIGGGFAGGFVVATLDVLPGSSQTPPPNNPPTSLSAPTQVSPAANARFAPKTAIAFDWSDVAGADGYTIQISDSDKFSSTIVNATVSSSQYTTSSLPTKTLWWRVRATSSAGISSGFTAARRFELK